MRCSERGRLPSLCADVTADGIMDVDVSFHLHQEVQTFVLDAPSDDSANLRPAH